MLSTRLKADCVNCCGLCCVAPAFDSSQGFGFDKPARQPCGHLDPHFRCAIHQVRHAHGFPGCASFDCYGAGQRVTQLFQGRTWRDSEELGRRMFDAYARYRELHELMALLEVAIAAAPDAKQTELRSCLSSIEQLCATGAALEGSIRVSELRAAVLARARAVLNVPRSDGATSPAPDRTPS